MSGAAPLRATRNQRIDADVIRDAKAFARSVQRNFKLFRGANPRCAPSVQHAVARLQSINNREISSSFVSRTLNRTRARHLGDQIPRFELEPLVLIGIAAASRISRSFCQWPTRIHALVGQGGPGKSTARFLGILILEYSVLSSQSQYSVKKGK